MRERGHQIFKFLKVLSFVAVISYNSYEPVYHQDIEKGEASEKIEDRYGHSIAPRKLFLSGSYLKPERSKYIS